MEKNYFVTRAFLILNIADEKRCREEIPRAGMDLWNFRILFNKIKDANLHTIPKKIFLS